MCNQCLSTGSPTFHISLHTVCRCAANVQQQICNWYLQTVFISHVFSHSLYWSYQKWQLFHRFLQPETLQHKILEISQNSIYVTIFGFYLFFSKQFQTEIPNNCPILNKQVIDHTENNTNMTQMQEGTYTWTLTYNHFYCSKGHLNTQTV